jgi:hypothetical protein
MIHLYYDLFCRHQLTPYCIICPHSMTRASSPGSWPGSQMSLVPPHTAQESPKPTFNDKTKLIVDHLPDRYLSSLISLIRTLSPTLDDGRWIVKALTFQSCGHPRVGGIQVVTRVRPTRPNSCCLSARVEVGVNSGACVCETSRTWNRAGGGCLIQVEDRRVSVLRDIRVGN